MKGMRTHSSKRRPVVYISAFRFKHAASRFALTVAYKNGRVKRHATSYANTQAAHRAARTFYPDFRIERVFFGRQRQRAARVTQ